MTLQENIDFQKYVRCFTFGKTDILPVVYDPGQRRYLIDHQYLSDELGARVVRDAQTIKILGTANILLTPAETRAEPASSASTE